jgi:hypothetical protein
MFKAIKKFLFGSYIEKGQQPVTVVVEEAPEVKAEPAVVTTPKSSGRKNTGKKPGTTTTKKKKVNEQRGNQKKRPGN